MTDLPLFPLHTVLTPGLVLPLHIFEPRYRVLVERCLDREEPFGVVWIREGREVGPGELALATVGTIAEIRSVDRLADGRFALLVAGTRRFAIESVATGTAPYLVASVTELDEPLGDPDRAAALTGRALRRFADYLRLLEPVGEEVGEPIDVQIELETEVLDAAEAADSGAADAIDADAAIDAATDASATSPTIDAGGRPATGIVIPDDPAVVSHLLAGIVRIEAHRRQDLLEASSAEVRLEGLLRLLQRETALLAGRLAVFTVGPVVEVRRRN